MRIGHPTYRLTADSGTYTKSGQNATLTYSGGSSTVTADLQASQTSGPAPLAVLFDATGTTSSDGTVDPWGEIGYSFDFGGVSGTWAYSSQSKDVQRGGPLAACVFETPGTYTVKMRARDSSGGSNNGDVDQAQVTITVTNPDTVFSSTNTICLSRNTDHTGAPAGASLQNNVTSWPSWTSNRRYLLHAGQDFSSLGNMTINQREDIQVGVYGSGADPIVASLGVESGNPNTTGTNWSERLSFTDLNVTGTISSGNSHLDVLFLRCSAGNGLDMGGTVGYYYDNPGVGGSGLQALLQRLRNTFVVECDVQGGANGNALTAWGRGLVLLGNTLHDPSVEHTSRIWQAYKSFFAHNHYSDAHSGRHHFKMHSSGDDAWDDLIINSPQPASSYIVVANNYVGTGSNDFPFAVGPQNTTVSEPPDEGVERVIYENNTFEADYMTELHMGGYLMYERGNSNEVGSFGYTDNYNEVKLPDGWPQSYSHSASAITTEDPV